MCDPLMQTVSNWKEPNEEKWPLSEIRISYLYKLLKSGDTVNKTKNNQFESFADWKKARIPKEATQSHSYCSHTFITVGGRQFSHLITVNHSVARQRNCLRIHYTVERQVNQFTFCSSKCPMASYVWFRKKFLFFSFEFYLHYHQGFTSQCP